MKLSSTLNSCVAFAVAIGLMLGLATAPRAVAADDRLNFTATTLSGAPFNGAGLQGKPAVLWFWTPFCPFCNAEAPGRQPGGGRQSGRHLRRRCGSFGRRADARLSCPSTA